MTIDEAPLPETRRDSTNPPIFNIPGIVLATILLLAAVHALRVFVLGDIADANVVLDFAFIPGCYVTDCVAGFGRSAGAGLWSPLTHALLHGDWMHLGLNTIWLVAFGTPVARRLGALRYTLFSVVGALAGAGLFDLVNPTLLEPVVGASGVVSALMGGACRFAFGSLGRSAVAPAAAPRLSIGQALADRTILIFIIVFFVTNLATASSFGSYLAGGATIAWEAHLGGFIFGFLGFALFDQRAR
ncbi:rhomboid family intramembrane serine protease [Aureimonas endophytica]|uniref:Rhomboid family intramembrane serine protease n=1 Tax=Aureimonas endophytica TaxID=2027858 RepID=A0A916ZDR3_9HYPH|nr:rhomboid family intramembrane serine protease [Aureimonas endophytica]GGD90502.1 rhomboid family intramembrane serine protease [Aureimonas endophytica]